MTAEIAVTLGVVAATLALLALEWLPADLLLLAALGVLTAAGIVDLDQALLGFAEPTLLALGALFVVAAGLRRTGVLAKTAHLLLGDGRSRSAVLARLTSAAGVSSAFLNNTPIVAMGIPAVLSWSRARGVAPSRLLIPLSYASILGGTCTLIGTSTNLVADGMMRAEGMAGLGFFELGALGLPLAVVGFVYLVVLAPRLLPDRASMDTEAPSRNVAGDVHLLTVPSDSPLVGRSLAAWDPGGGDVQLARLVRDDGTVADLDPDLRIRAGDRLTLRGSPDAVSHVAERSRLEGVEVDDLPDLGPGARLREAVVAGGSELIGDHVGDIAFKDRYGAVILGIVRGGRQLDRTTDVTLRAGDLLLLVASPEFDRTFADSRHLYLLGGSDVAGQSLADVPLWRPTRAKWGLAILGGIVGLAAFDVAHISLLALGGAVLMVAAGFVTPGEARRSVDWSVLLVIGAAVGIGGALEQSGAARLVADGVVAVGVPLGPRGILAALLVGTMLFTLTVTNNAAIAIVFPVATAVASSQGLDPRPLVIAVTVGASLAFATPLGYQTNLMVYGPGGYGFRDFLRAGLPLQVLTAVVTVLVVPWIWAF